MKPTDERQRPPLLDSKDAAELLGVAVGTLRRHASLGTVPSVKFGRARNSHRFFEVDVIETLRQGGHEGLDELLAHRNRDGAVA